MDRRSAPALGGDHRPRSGDEPQLSAARLVGRVLDVLRAPDAPFEARQAAGASLARLGPNAIPHLLGLMHDDDPLIRRAAARALGLIADRCVTGRLVKAAHWTYQAVQAADDPRTVPDLLAAFVIGSRPTRVAVAAALGRLGDRRAVPELIEALGDDALLPRLAALDALGRIGAPEAVPHLTDALEDPDHTVRSAAADALAQIARSNDPCDDAVPEVDDRDNG